MIKSGTQRTVTVWLPGVAAEGDGILHVLGPDLVGDVWDGVGGDSALIVGREHLGDEEVVLDCLGREALVAFDGKEFAGW